MPPRATQEVTREQLEGLRNKFELLQGDRKAYFETYETQKRQNDDLLKTEREKNKQLRRDLASLHKAAAAGENGSTQEAEKLQRELAQQRKAHDQLRAQARKRKKEKDALAAQLRDLELEGKKPTEDDSPQMRKIRNLENRLDKAMIKYNEAQSIRKTYEQIVKRLKEEKVGFDNQLKALQRTLEAKRQDLEELRMLAGDANHAKEVAIRELERVRAFAQEEKNRLSQQIREKENAAKKKFQLDELTRERARMRQDIVQEVEGDLGLEEEEQLKQTLEQNKRWKEVVAEETDEQRRKIGMYEDAFRRIKEATGVSDVNEVIQKVLSQDQQQQSLEQLTKTNATRIEALNKDLAALKERVDELKFSGGGGGRTAARRMVDSFEEKLAASQQRLDRAKEKYDRVAKILINAQAGVHHLTQKLASVRGEDEGELLGVTEDDSIVDVLCHCEASMQTIYGKVKQFEEEVRATRKVCARGRGLTQVGAGLILGMIFVDVCA